MNHFDIQRVVTELSEVRVEALKHRHRSHRPPKLPSRKALSQVIEGLSAALFPNRLGDPDIRDTGLDFFVGHTLDIALRELQHQIQLELNFNATSQSQEEKQRNQQIAFEKTQSFAYRLADIRRVLDTDILAAYEGDPAASSVDEVLVCYPGIHAIIHYRIAHALHELDLPIVARMISELAHSHSGIDIHPGAQIGHHFFIDHGTGVVIGATAIIGNHVRIYQAVTLGAKSFPKDEQGHLIKGQPRHPILEDDVVVYAGATILGRITIGKGSIVGGNIWLTHSVAPNSHVTQALSQENPIKQVA